MSKHLFAELRIPIELDNPSITRDEEKCIKCGACRRVCEEIVSVGRLYDLDKTGDRAICINCGQCANVCPTDAITEVYEYQKVRDYIQNPNYKVIFSTSPSVRVGLGESFLMSPGAFVEGQMTAALRALGADYVLDTNFAADLTIMEEAAELIERITKKEKPLPQFTSCCPAWVKFAETFYPSVLPHISSAKSPIGMQGPTIKTYFAKEKGLDPAKIINVALTPCTAKKFEIRREEMADAATYLQEDELRDMDFVITTRELAIWMKEEGIDLASLPNSDFDQIMGPASGGGIIFGNTGGVMEAALRTAYFMITSQNPPASLLEFKDVRGMEGVKEATVSIDDLVVKVAVVHGTDYIRPLLDQLKEGKSDYHFIEVMNCHGGCIGGGGQPKTEIPMTDAVLNKRIEALYLKDKWAPIRNSHENPDIIEVYKKFYEAPLSERAEAMLHTTYKDRSQDLGGPVVEKPFTYGRNEKQEETQPGANHYRCKICGYVHEGDELSEDFVCPVCKQGKAVFEQI